MNNATQEHELKLTLPSREDFERLAALLGEPVRVLTQTNLYFDDEHERWVEAKWSVRARRIGDDALELTVKGPSAREGALVRRGEWTCPLPLEQWEPLRQGKTSLAPCFRALHTTHPELVLPASLEVDALRPLGEMVNIRNVFPLPGEGPPLEVELDVTSYPDGELRYEVELEIPPGAATATDADAHASSAETRLRRCFEAAGVPWSPSQKSKAALFRKALRKVRQPPKV